MAGQPIVLVFLVSLTACAGGGLPPVSDRSPELEKPVFVNGVFRHKNPAIKHSGYLVQAGDTLYSIAWRFDKDFKELARSNSIQPPYLIQPGQRLSLSVVPARRMTNRNSRTPSSTKPDSRNYSITPRELWRWPASGPTMRAYGKTNAGVDIRVKSGTSVVASAEGEVVYAGRGLRGFEYLIIIKHSEQILSAYGVNQNIFVKEGQVVKAGTRLADIRLAGIARETLHFEIRRNGDHLNPASYIRGRS